MYDWHDDCPLPADTDLCTEDVIIEVNGEEVRRPEQVRKCVALARANGDIAVEMIVQRRQLNTPWWDARRLTIPLPGETRA